jgi:hypothetical protein
MTLTSTNWIAIAAILVGGFLSLPAWLNYLKERNRRLDLQGRLSLFREQLGAEMKRRRQDLNVSLEDIAGSVSPDVTSSDVTRWEKTGTVPYEHIGRALDVLGVSEWDYRAMALKRLTSEEVVTHIDPYGQRGNAESSLVSARRTWSLAGRYASLTIPVVAAQSTSKSQFRQLSSPNYTYLDNLTDRDTLIEVAKILSRLYPYSETSLECSRGYSAPLKRRPSVVVGGIGFPGKPNNEFSLEIFETLGLSLTYEDMALVYDGKRFESESRDGVLIKDGALFARIHSPVDPDVPLIFIQGTHTRGVYGASKAFSLDRRARINHETCLRVVGDRDFIAVFTVEIVGGDVRIPQLGPSDFHVLP